MPNIVRLIEHDIEEVEDWVKNLIDRNSSFVNPPANVPVPLGDANQQIVSLLDTIANQNQYIIAFLQRIADAHAPIVNYWKWWHGAMTSTYDSSGTSYFEFPSFMHHLTLQNKSSTQPAYFSFDGVSDAGYVDVGETVQPPDVPPFTKLFVKSADTASQVFVYTW